MTETSVVSGPARRGGPLIEPDITSSPPFQLPTPSLPGPRKAAAASRLASQASNIAGSSQAPVNQISTSPTAGSSPTLPPLPCLSKGALVRSAQFSSPPQQKSDSTYYTALWGSPYELPSSSRAAQGDTAAPRRRNSVLTTDGSPLRHSNTGFSHDTGQESLKSTRFFRRSYTSDEVSSSPFCGTARGQLGQQTYDLTGDWIRNYKQERIEKRTWLSDESDNGSHVSDESEFEEFSGGPEEASTERDPKTPRASQLNQNVLQERATKITASRLVAKHRTGLNNPTLTQQDFNNIIKTRSEKAAEESKMLSAFMSGAAMPKRDRRSSSTTEKSLPPPPVNRTVSESPVMTTQDTNAARPIPPKRPSISSMASFQRPKKKVTWRGRGLVIALPLEVGKDANGNPKVPLKPEEVAARLERWAREGYSIRGFDLSDEFGYSEVMGQSRGVFPDTDDFRSEIQARKFPVKLPNKKSFEENIDQLIEQKLAALGVSAKGGEPTMASPGISTMSRQASSQNSFAPSLSSGPGAPHQLRGQMENTFSPPLTAPNPQFPFTQPLVSPGAVPPGPRSAGFHLPKQSIAFNPGQAHNTAPYSQQTPSLPGAQAPQPYLGSLPSSRGVSPLIDGRRQSIRVSNSPVSPLPETGDGYFNALAQLPPHLRQQAGQIHPALMHQAMQQQKASLQRQVNDNLTQQQPIRYVSQPDIASPLPQGHRHNLSETLQKEIENTENRLEDSISHQLGNKDHPASRSDKAEEPKSTGKQETIPEEEPSDSKTGTSDVDTNPSLVNSPMPQSGGLPPLSAHTPKTSSSKLNVKAQEFVLDPTKAAFTPMFTFGDRSTTFSGPTSATSTSGIEGAHSKNTSDASTFSSGLNVAAPAFVPGKVQVPPQLSSTTNRVFSFSSSLSGSKPSGLNSTPGYAFNSGAPIDSEKAAQAPKIFSDVIQPAKKSKAIPIVKPEEESDPEHKEDESGRITQAAGRQKRARRGGGSGDQIPLFADMPASVPSMPEKKPEGAEEKSKEEYEEQLPKHPIPAISTPEPTPPASPTEKSIDGPLNTADFLKTPTNPASPNSPVGKANNELKAMVDNISDGGAQVQGPVEDPFAVGDQEDEGATDKSRPQSRPQSPPHSPPRSPPVSSAEDKPEAVLNGSALAPNTKPASEVVTPGKKSALSPMAKPFEFNPAASAFKPPESYVESSSTTPAEPRSPAVPAAVKKPAMMGGLGASRYAMRQPSEPPRESSPPPMHEPTTKIPESSADENAIESLSDSTKGEQKTPVRGSSFEVSPKASLPTSPRPDSPTQPMDERIVNGVQYVEPASYQEIDDVMKQYGDDSDAGVERNPAEAWRSPVRRATDEHRYAPIDGLVAREYVSDAEHHLRKSPLRVTASPNKLAQPFQYLPDKDYNSSDSAKRSAVAEYVARNPRLSPSYKKPRRPSFPIDSPVHKLNRADNASISEWDDVVSSGEEEAFNARVGFFDNRVSHVVANAIEDRLQPLETALANLTTELTRRSNRSRGRRHQRSASADIENSDADDEDEETTPGRGISPFVKDRKFEKLRSLLLEVVNSQRPAAIDDTAKVLETLGELKTALNRQQQEPGVSKSDMGNEAISKITDAIGELKSSFANQSTQAATPTALSNEEMANMTKAIAQLQVSMNEQKGRTESPQDIRAVIEEVLNKHSRKNASKKSVTEAPVIEKLQLQVAGLESMLKIQESRANDEYKSRREVEDRLADSQRELKVAAAEAAQNRDIAEETETSLRSFLDEQQQTKQHVATLEEIHTAQEKNLSDLTEKNIALEETISEYRISHDNWRTEIDEATTHNEDLQRTISSLRDELEDGIKSKQALRDRLERLQEDTAEATRNIARDQAAWRHKEEEHKAKHELSSARLEAEARTRERLELEIERLEKQEREAKKSRFLVEQVRNENGNLSAIANDLRSKSHQFQERSMALERELHDTKERSHLEIQRIMVSTKGDVEAANQQVNILRENLEGVIGRLESQLESARKDANLAKERYELMLEEASASKDNALREAAEAREAALQEHYRFHERTLGETRASHDRAVEELKKSHERLFENSAEDHGRAMINLVEDHKRALQAASEERRISEQELNGRLALSGEKIQHLQDRAKHLEERLSIAKSAAQAAADAARSARGSTPQPTARSSMPSMIASRNSEIPEKISPQALRESILVLQEQLHERESRIEKLEQQLSEVDHEAPNKIKERDIEIGWLRELLGVRLDDLQEIIVSLSSPTFNREAVRDAVIRLRANLQMEQQEKERAMAGGQKMPSLSSLAASPRSLPMAAAAAWGSWRKGQTSLSSLAEMAVPSVATSANQTPSRSSSQSFLSGLLTPPNTSLRQTPQPRAGMSRPQSSSARRPLGGYSTPKRQLSSTSYDARRPLADQSLAPPETPPLLRKNNYDADAHERSTHHYSLERYVTDPPAEGEGVEEAGDGDEMLGALPDERSEGTSDNGGDVVRGLGSSSGPEGLFGPSIELES